MITVRGQLRVARSAAEVWAFVERFDDLARCIPSLKSFRVDGDVVEGRLGVTLGVVPVESQVRLEITERVAPACIEARGVSYLGETVSGLRPGRAGSVTASDTGSMLLHLDLRADGDGHTRLAYGIGIEAQGRLRKIYESIVRLKLPAFERDFRERLAAALAAEVTRLDGAPTLCDGAERRLAAGAAATKLLTPAPPPEPPRTIAVALPRPSWWRRFVLWVRRLLGKHEHEGAG